MLRLEGLEAAYGVSQVLFGITLGVEAGQLVTLLGRNGMGKTTTVRAVMGIVPVRAGRVHFEGRPLHGLPPHRVAQAGLGLVPEGRQVFPNLTVRENLVATAANRRRAPEPWTIERVFELLPALAARARSMGATLSGGEQQMLAIGRILRTGARLLLLDEPTAGMAHEDVGRISSLIKKVAANRTVLMVEHNLSVVENLSDTITVLSRGEVLAEGDYQSVSRNPDVVQAYLGTAHV